MPSIKTLSLLSMKVFAWKLLFTSDPYGCFSQCIFFFFFPDIKVVKMHAAVKNVIYLYVYIWPYIGICIYLYAHAYRHTCNVRIFYVLFNSLIWHLNILWGQFWAQLYADIQKVMTSLRWDLVPFSSTSQKLPSPNHHLFLIKFLYL